MRSDFAAAAMESRYMSCMLSPPPPGELTKNCAVWPPAGASGGKYAAPCSTRPVISIQFSMNAACSCATTGPSMRKCVSRQCPGPCASPAHSSAMPTPPVKPTRPSTTRSLRCVRLFIWASVYQRSGLYFSTSTPAAVISSTNLSSILPAPTASKMTCTLTPALARSARARLNAAPIAPE